VADNAYRKFLEECETAAAADFDKTTVALSGGALGISLAFIKDLAPNAPKWSVVAFLLTAWVALALSLLGVLLSLMASMKSMRHALDCLDGRRESKPGEKAGGPWRDWTEFFNSVALAGCVGGVTLLVLFSFVAIWSRK
jgi:hypothetical protein